jgi:hypothetical protein
MAGNSQTRNDEYSRLAGLRGFNHVDRTEKLGVFDYLMSDADV